MGITLKHDFTRNYLNSPGIIIFYFYYFAICPMYFILDQFNLNFEMWNICKQVTTFKTASNKYSSVTERVQRSIDHEYDLLDAEDVFIPSKLKVSEKNSKSNQVLHLTLNSLSLRIN